jgi:hypothetical protein
MLASSQDEGESKERQLHDSDLIGDYNHRTGRLDAWTTGMILTVGTTEPNFQCN